MHDINIPIYVGYDERESEAYKACVKSLNDNSSIPLNIMPIKMKDIKEKGLYYREKDALSSTEFSFSRFLVPHMNGYKGWVLFCDCDFIFNTDVKELFNLIDDKYAIMVCKHDYEPKTSIKMDGKIQSKYPRKNWSSLMLINCGHELCKKLTIEVVNTESGSYLHRFTWIPDEYIGEIPIQWNWLVGYYKEPLDGIPKALHFTDGGPWFENYKNVEYSDVYFRYSTM